MTTILLIRHGENDFVKKGRLAGRLPGVHLNAKGRAQAEQLAKFLTNKRIKTVYSSPLERAMETAQPIAAALGSEVIIRQGLQEVDFGEWQDKTLKQLRRRKLWRVVQSSPSRVRFPAGESFAEAQLRICNEIDDMCSLHKPNDRIVCVGHSDMIKLTLAYYLGMPIDSFQRIIILPASISTINIGVHGARVFGVNHVIHPEKHEK